MKLKETSQELQLHFKIESPVKNMSEIIQPSIDLLTKDHQRN